MKKITMKGQTNYDFDLIVVSHERQLLPNQNDEYRTIAGRDGQEHIARELSNIEITVEFAKPNRSNEQWIADRKRIVAWLHSREEIQVEFDEYPGGHFIGKVTVGSIPENWKPGRLFSVTFTLHPFQYGESKINTMTYGSIMNLENTGNYETPFILQAAIFGAYGGPTNPVNLWVNEVLAVQYFAAIPRNGVITVDAENMEVRIGGAIGGEKGELKILEVKGAFPELRPGMNTLGFTFGNQIAGTSPHLANPIAVQMKVTHQERTI